MTTIRSVHASFVRHTTVHHASTGKYSTIFAQLWHRAYTPSSSYSMLLSVIEDSLVFTFKVFDWRVCVRRHDLHAGQGGRIARKFGLDALEDEEEVPRCDPILRADNHIATRLVAGNRVGPVLGAPHERVPIAVGHVGNVCCAGTPPDEPEQAVHRISGFHLVLPHCVLLVDLVLHDVRTHIRFAAVVLPHCDAPRQDGRDPHRHYQFLHVLSFSLCVHSLHFRVFPH